MPESLQHDGQLFTLAYKNNAVGFNVFLYTPKGETVDNYTQMISVYHDSSVENPLEIIQTQQQELSKLDYAHSLDFNWNKQTQTGTQSYFIQEYTGKKSIISEYNVRCFSKAPASQKGVYILTYATRHYGTEGLDVFQAKTLKNNQFRENALQTLAAFLEDIT